MDTVYILCIKSSPSSCVCIFTCALTVMPLSRSTFNLSNTCLFDPFADIVFVNSNRLVLIIGEYRVRLPIYVVFTDQLGCFYHDLFIKS